MGSIVKQKLQEARSRSVGMAKAIGSAAGGGMSGGNPLGLGNASNYGIGSKRTDLTQHTEQYRHNQGWVSSSIGPIAKRVARQPIYIARVKKAPDAKAMPSYGQKSTSYGRAIKPWEPRKETAQSIWLKRHLPASFKQLAATADVLDSHPMLDALEDPNPIMVRWSLLFVTVASLLLTGKAYWWIQAREREDDKPEAKATPRIEIWPLPSNWVKPVHTEERLYASWEVTPDGALEPTPVPAEQIVYFYFPDPSTPLGAQSTLQTCARAVVSDEAIAEAQRRAFANGVYPGVAVVVGRQPDVDGTPGERPALNREQRAQIITAFKQAYRGVYNADEPIILDQIIQDVKRVTNTNREMDFMQSGTYTKDRITQTFGVNPIVMGQVEGANRASSATADDHLCQSTVNPIIELISEILTAWLNPLFAAPGEKLVAFIEEAHAVDPDSDRADYDLLARTGAVSRDELRAGLRNLPPMVDGDTALVQAGLMQIDARLASEAKGQANPAKPIGSDSGTDTTAGTSDSEPKPLAKPDGTPAQISEPASRPVATSVPDAGAAALNGAQISSLLEVLDKLAAGQYPPDAVSAILSSAFPTLSGDTIQRLITAIRTGAKPPSDDDTDNGSDGTTRTPVPVANGHTRSAQFVCDVVAIVQGNKADGTPGTVEIPIEAVRQAEPYDCGAAAGYMAARYCGVAPDSYADFVSLVHTEQAYGTHADDLLAFFAHHGCNPKDRDSASLNILRANIRTGRLCLCAVQYFGDGNVPFGEGGTPPSGHWIVVNGYTPTAIKYVCPIDGPGEIANSDFLGNWYDQDQDGTPLVRYVLSVAPMPGTERAGQVRLETKDSAAQNSESDSDEPGEPKRTSAYYCKAHRLSIKERADMWLAAHTTSERELEGILIDFFNAEATRIIGAVDEALKATEWRAANVTEFKGGDDAPDGDDLDPALGKLLDRLVPLGTTTNRLRLAVRPALEAVAIDGAAQENDALEPLQRSALDAWVKRKKPVDRKPLGKPIRKRVNAYLDDMVNDPYWQDINKTTRLKVARAVRRGLANNESVASIKKRIQAVLAPLNNATRATMIARTEATAALNIGFQAAREHYGTNFVKGKQWTCSALHTNVRASHEKANGQFRKLGSKFRVGGVWCEYPGDPVLPPGERCGCRCVALTVPAD